MNVEVIVFAIMCIVLLACMWRGGPCATLWRRAKDWLQKAPLEKTGGSDETSGQPAETRDASKKP